MNGNDYITARDAQALFMAAIVAGVWLAIEAVCYWRLRRAARLRPAGARAAAELRTGPHVPPLCVVRFRKPRVEDWPAAVRARALGVDELQLEDIDDFSQNAEWTPRRVM